MGDVVNRRHDVDGMVPLRPQFAPGGNALRPGDDHAVAGAAVVAGDLLGPLERGAHGMRPGARVVVVGRGGSDFVHPLEDLFDVLANAVEEGHLVEQALRAAFGARAVVTGDVDDHRVVELAGFADRLDHPADVVIRLFEEASVDLHHAGVDLLLLVGQRVPGRQARRERVELGVGGNHAELLLALKRLLANRVPALVELALVLLDPLLLGVVRGVGRPRGVVTEERLLGGDRLLHSDPLDRLVGHVVVEVVVGLAEIRFDRLGALHDGRTPLARVATDEAIEVIESQSGRPEIKRSGLARLPVGHVVVLAEPGGAIAVLLQDLRDGGGVLLHDRVISGKPRGRLGDHPGVHGMMVPAGDQRRPGGAAQRGGVELIVFQPVVSKLLQNRRIAWPAESAGGSKADVIQKN